MLPSNWLTTVIEWVAGVALAAYLFRVFGSRLLQLLPSRRPADLRTQELLLKRNEQAVPSHEMVSELTLRSIRAAQTDDTITCLIVNDGSTVMNLHIEADDLPFAGIVPSDLLVHQQTGHIKLGLPQDGPEPEALHFTIRYEDTRGHPNRAAYTYVFRDKHLMPAPTRDDAPSAPVKHDLQPPTNDAANR